MSTSSSSQELAREHAAGLASSTTDRASDVSRHAADAASETLSGAAQGASAVKDETVAQAKDLIGQVRDQVRTQANSQLGQLGSTMRELASQLDDMSQKSDHDTTAHSLVSDIAQRTHRMADMVEGREVNDLLDDLRDFARRRPMAFLIGAAGLGLVAGRIGRGMRDARQSAENAPSPYPPPYPTEPSRQYPMEPAARYPSEASMRYPAESTTQYPMDDRSHADE